MFGRLGNHANSEELKLISVERGELNGKKKGEAKERKKEGRRTQPICLRNCLFIFSAAE